MGIKKIKYDKTLIGSFAIGKGVDEVGHIIDFEGKKTLIGYSWGHITFPSKNVHIVKKEVRYLDEKTGKLVLKTREGWE